jgi:hypothetical protein
MNTVQLEWRGPYQEETPLEDWQTWKTDCGKYKVIRAVSKFGDVPHFSACYGKHVSLDNKLQTLREALNTCERFAEKAGCLVTSNKAKVLASAEQRGLHSFAEGNKKEASVMTVTMNRTIRTISTVRQLRMEVSRADAVALLAEAGLRKAGEFPLDKLEQKIRRIDVDFEEHMIKDPDMKGLYGDICRTKEEGGVITVVDDHGDEDAVVAAAPTKKPAKPAKKAGPKKGGKTPGKGEKKPVRKAGVISTIVECLSKATEKRPVTKEQILAVCVERFGPGTEQNRRPESMKNTISAQVPTGLKIEKPHLTVMKNGDGYYLAK